MKNGETYLGGLFRRVRLDMVIIICSLIFFCGLCAFKSFKFLTQEVSKQKIVEPIFSEIYAHSRNLESSSKSYHLVNNNSTLLENIDNHVLIHGIVHDYEPLVNLTLNDSGLKTKKNNPTLDIMCRTFHGGLFEILRFILTYLLFFPKDVMQTKIVLVFDSENKLDHMTASILETAFKEMGLKVFFEEPPPPHTLTSTMRDEGFSRSQWSNFYSDLYSNADFIGMIDSDTEFSFRPSIENHLIINLEKPVIYGIYFDNWPFFPHIKYMIGVDAVAEFMYVFPFIVKREHFLLMRQHIVKTTGVATFEQAWFEVQQRYSHWGQFVIMGNYLFHFHHDEYAWDITNKPISTVENPCPHVGKNLPMHQDVKNTVQRYHNQMCVQSRDMASECLGMSLADQEIAKIVPFTDFWPIADGEGCYNYPASKSRADGLAPYSPQEVFDARIDEIFSSGGEQFWQNTWYNASERTKNPAAISSL